MLLELDNALFVQLPHSVEQVANRLIASRIDEVFLISFQSFRLLIGYGSDQK